MRRIYFIACILSVISFKTFACDPIQSPLFHPDEEKFEWHEDSKTGYVVHLPRLKIEKIEIERGVGNDGFSCLDAGRLTVKLSLPDYSPFKFDEIGVYIKVVKNNGGEDILAGHQYPMSPMEANGKTAEYSTVWLDGSPKEHKKINLEVEIFVISHNLEIGPSTYGKIVSPGGH